MGLPLLEVRGFIPGMKLKLTSTATERSMKDLLHCSSVHAHDRAPVTQVRSCKECGEVNPETVLVTQEGVTWCRDKPDSPYFEVRGWENAKDVEYSLVKDKYFVEINAAEYATANLCKALGRSLALTGYTRLTANSDERVAVLHSPEKGVLVLDVLYYLDTEATQPVKVVKEPSSWNNAATFMRKLILDNRKRPVAQLNRREYTDAVKLIDKEVNTAITQPEKGRENGKPREASR